MSLDGLRAWIGVVERKLLVRTRVFLVLVAIAVGGSAAALYLAVDAQENSVTEADVETVREELEGRTGESGGAEVASLEAQLEALRGEVAELRTKGNGAEATDGAGATPDGGTTPGGVEPPTDESTTDDEQDAE
jgi:hypothetical protein